MSDLRTQSSQRGTNHGVKRIQPRDEREGGACGVGGKGSALEYLRDRIQSQVCVFGLKLCAEQGGVFKRNKGFGFLAQE